ncbi:cysteine desulfurase [Rhodococcus sp. WMMA185]|uniref:cysteine desulfurase family protein n=1 Tax=Rhodococcus sp. WMMA185 TaxID=679318 RepID=UPI00087835F7|nr:cysteine desulfurase family protein [Rhodococcus sp. WMMA185]AOW92536.1 cysteine desulfurase [Rhodococcus sp. WMMA185]
MIYLDYNASTPVDPRVETAMAEASSQFANPSSVQHRSGQGAAEVVEEARSHVADLVRRPARDIVLTSGASEAAALGIIGAALGAQSRPNIVVAATEHKAVLSAADVAAKVTGGEVRCARVDRSGLVDLSHLEELIDDTVSLVAVMAANNETGVLGPSAIASELARHHGALLFSDVTQLAGKGDMSDVVNCSDLLVCSSHKVYGPKGAGALVASRHIQRRLVPIFSGGGQEFGLRGGTQNTPALAGFGRAAQLAAKEQPADTQRLARLTDELSTGLRLRLSDVEVNGIEAERLTNTLSLRFRCADAEAVMTSMPRIAVSSGSACQSATPSQSHVLLAMGLTHQAASETLRISLGRPTTLDEIARAIDEIASAVMRVRELTTRSEG